MTYRERQRLADIRAAIDAVGSHLTRGDLTDGLVFDAVRIRLLEIGEAVKALPAELLATEPDIPRAPSSRACPTIGRRRADVVAGPVWVCGLFPGGAGLGWPRE